MIVDLPQSDSQQTSSRWTQIVFVLILLLSAALFVARGPWRAVHMSDDFDHIYAASRAWVMGLDPYDPSDLDNAYSQGNPSADRRARSLLSLYPPPMFVVVSPFAMLPLELAAWMWMFINVLYTVLLLFMLLRLFPVKAAGAHVAVTAGVLLFAPIHTAIANGQLTMPAACFGVTAVFLSVNSWHRSAGLVLSLALAFKPQLAALFLVWAIVRSDWRTVLWTFIGITIISAIVLIRMAHHELQWVAGLFDNIDRFAGTGRAGNPAPENPLRFQLINLSLLLFSFTDSHLLVTITSWTVVLTAGILACWLWLRRRNDDPHAQTLLAILCVLDLLVVYHRFYDAVLLLVPLAWAIYQLTQRRYAWIPWIIVALTAIFFVPGAAILYQLVAKGHVSHQVSQSWWWDALVMSHQIWALLAMLVCLITWQWISPARRTIGD